MKKIWIRLKSETPIFWKKFRNMAIGIGAAAIAVKLADAQYVLHLPEAILQTCSYAIAVCAALGMSSQLTVNDNNK